MTLDSDSKFQEVARKWANKKFNLTDATRVSFDVEGYVEGMTPGYEYAVTEIEVIVDGKVHIFGQYQFTDILEELIATALEDD